MQTTVLEQAQTPLQRAVATSACALWIRGALFAAWLGLVVAMVARHAMFRDEVRAYSFAVQGANPWQMLQLLRGEGHPALWYLLLRGAHALVPLPIVLPALALIIAAVAAGLLVFRSGLPILLLAALLCTHVILFEYAVMARNYGITMLLLFGVALVYPTRERHPWLLGSLLFLIANTNVHAVLLAGSFLLFLAVEERTKRGDRGIHLSRTFWAACAGVALGAVCCFVMVRSPFNDAAQASAHHDLLSMVRGITLPAESFDALVPHVSGSHLHVLASVLLSLMLVGSTLILLPSFGAVVAALAALFSMAALFSAIYGGYFRHQALWLVFLLTLYWIVRREDIAAAKQWPQRIGIVCALFLLAFQMYGGVHRALVTRHTPESDSRAFAGWLREHPEYSHAWIVADPDYLVEPLRYYVDNPTYLLREDRPGSIVIFTRQARLRLTLGEIVARAKELQTLHKQLVLILLDGANLGAGNVSSGYNWTTDESREQADLFRSSTQRVASFPRRPSDEAFEVFALR